MDDAYSSHENYNGYSKEKVFKQGPLGVRRDPMPRSLVRPWQQLNEREYFDLLLIIKSKMDSESWMLGIVGQDKKYPKIAKKFSYGTSGFRTLGKDLERVGPWI